MPRRRYVFGSCLRSIYEGYSPISLKNQLFLLIVMVGNLLEKSLAWAAIFTATWRAMPL